ncbi:MAG TPA: methyltransferase [Desulfotomaculum sp.]|nr:methyltransferase [Desulfotomaculum sp.]
MSMKPKDRVLGLLTGQGDVDRVACYSGMGNVTVAGLEEYGYNFPEVHGDAKKMATLAASSYRLFDYECAVVPFDLCVEAGAMGCVMNAYEDVNQLLYPTIKEKIIHDPEQMTSLKVPDNLAEKGRVPVVTEAIRLLKQDIGDDVAVGTYILGPYTLAGQIMDLNDLFKLTFKKPDQVNAMLDVLADVLIEIAGIYRKAGADYICVREMGATSDILSPKSFSKVIYPHLKKIFAQIDYPKILHICGSTNKVITNMYDCGADAISVETKNDLAQTRADIGWEPLVFGHVDSFNVLVNGSEEDVRAAVLSSIDAGVDAVWPGCDIWPTAPVANLKAMTDTVKEFGASRWVRKQKK